MVKNLFSKTKLLFVGLAVLLFSLTNLNKVSAQTVQIGTGNVIPANTLYGPIYRFTATSTTTGARCNMIFTAAELTAAGITTGSTITSISFNKTNAANFVTPATYQIYMGNTSNTPPLATTTTWASILASHTQVFASTSYNIPMAAGWVDMPLTTPFVYTGGSLEIATHLEMVGNGGATDAFKWEYTTGFTTSIVGVSTSTGTILNGTVAGYKHRPNIKITYVGSTPCTNPPSAGTIQVPLSTICPGQSQTLSLTGNSTGVGLTYEWESSPNNTTFTSIAAPNVAPSISITPAASTWYRCKVVCSNGTPVYTPAVQITVAQPLSGVYTINSANPTAGTNFTSFSDAIEVLNCAGVNGAVTFNVAPNSGPYNERLVFGNINGTSATNTVTINGAGNTVSFSTTTSDRIMLELNGTKHLKIDNLVFAPTGTTYGWGANIYGGAQYDTVSNCTFNITESSSTTSSYTAGIVFSGSNTTVTTAGNAKNCGIINNTLTGPTGAGGMLHGIVLTSGTDSNLIVGNTVSNFYTYGIYSTTGKSNIIKNNTIHRATKSSVSTFYGIYLTGAINGTIVDANRIHTPGGTATAATSTAYGIYTSATATTSDPYMIANNVVYNFNQGGVIYGVYGTGTTNGRIYHNTFNIDQAMSSTSATYGMYLTGTNTNTEVKNNLVSITAGTSGIKYGFYYNAAASIGDAQKNNIYVNSTQAGVQNYGYYTTAYASQTAFQTAYPLLEVGSPTFDPLYVNAAIGNFLPGNMALNATGENLLNIVAQDIEGNNRAALPTPGAFEIPSVSGPNGGLVDLINPTGLFCSGNQNVDVSVMNAGTTVLSNFQIHWQVNGVTQTPYTYTGTLNTPVSTGQFIDTITIGSASFAPGNNTIKAWVVVPGDIFSGNDTIEVLNLTPANFAINALSDSICIGNDAILTLSPSAGLPAGAIQWQSSTNGTTFTNITGANTAVHTESNVTATTYFRAFINAGISGCYSNVDTVNTVNVVAPTVTNAQRCDTGSVVLSASAPQGLNINWYESATSPTPIFTGNTFTTNSLTSTTTYYVSSSNGTPSGGGLPELMYYKFDVPGNTVQNDATAPVGVNPAPITTLTVGGTGQFGTALQGVGATGNASRVDPGWTGTHNGSWTISFWMNAPNPTTTRYYFGNSTGNNTFRCFIGGAASGIRLTGGTPTMTLDMPSWTPGAKVITYVYDQTAGTVSGYIDGVFQAAASPGTSYPLVGTNFLVGAQGNSISGEMDEFRMYSRALSANEIASTWNTPLGGSCESARVPVTATITPNPTLDLGPDVAICSSASTTLNANSTTANASYTWNTNATTPTISVNTPGTYSVTVTAEGCAKSDTIEVTAAPSPIANLSDTVNICNGNTATLDAGNNGSTFDWSTGASTQTITTNTAGWHKVTVTTANNCAIEDSTFIVLNPLPIVDLGNDTAICPNTSFSLDAGNAGATYLWSTGALTQTIDPSQDGIYSVIVTDANGCEGTDEIEITLFDAATVDGFNFTPQFDIQSGLVAFAPINPQFVDEYLWDFGDGNTSTLQAPTNVYQASGNYTVSLSVTNECGTNDTSITIRVDLVTGIKKVNSEHLLIDVYPVPAKDALQVATKANDNRLESISIVNALGQEVQVNTNINQAATTLNLSSLADGNYYLKIKTKQGEAIKKFTVIK